MFKPELSYKSGDVELTLLVIFVMWTNSFSEFSYSDSCVNLASYDELFNILQLFAI